jgi:hypothetical protein
MKAALENAREFDLENVGKLWVEFFDKSVKQP